MNGYSKKEFEMIKELSPFWANLIETGKDGSIMPPELLKLVAMECFLENKQGKAVDSLRRCVTAIRNCNPYRCTPAYEVLIELDEKKSLYQIGGADDGVNCPLCGKELGGCHIGTYCNDDNCGYVDGYAMLTVERAKEIKDKIGWGNPEQQLKYRRSVGLED